MLEVGGSPLSGIKLLKVGKLCINAVAKEDGGGKPSKGRQFQNEVWRMVFDCICELKLIQGHGKMIVTRRNVLESVVDYDLRMTQVQASSKSSVHTKLCLHHLPYLTRSRSP
jgi:hypothetical protein